jgi:hypothetical protein
MIPETFRFDLDVAQEGGVYSFRAPLVPLPFGPIACKSFVLLASPTGFEPVLPP